MASEPPDPPPVAARDLVRVPGLISLSRIPLALLFSLSLSHSRRALAILLAAGASDMLDGWYARRFHQQTSTGALVDGVADKIFALTVVSSLALSTLAKRRGRGLSLGEIVLLGTRELGELALGLRLAAARRGDLHRIPSANAGGKLATTLQYAAIGAVILGSPLRRALIAATAAAGVAASISYWRREVASFAAG